MEEKEIIEQLQILKEIKPDTAWKKNLELRILSQTKSSKKNRLFGFLSDNLSYFRFILTKPAFLFAGFVLLLTTFSLIGLFNISNTKNPVVSINPNVNFNDPTRYLAIAEEKLQEIQNIAQTDDNQKIAMVLKNTQDIIEKAANSLPLKPQNPKKAQEIVKRVAVINKKAEEISKRLGVKIDSSSLTSKTEEMIKNGIEDTTEKIVSTEIKILENSSLNDDQKKLFAQAKELYQEEKYQEALEKILELTNNQQSK